MRLTGVYFDLTDRITPEPAAARRSVGDNEADRDRRKGLSHPDDVVLLISVAKRLIPSAVRRNTVKRIVRESWRAAGRYPFRARLDISQSIQGTSSGSARQNVQNVQNVRGDRRTEAIGGKTFSRVCLVRLKRYPGLAVKTGGAVSPGIGEAAIRRSLRADVDGLFHSFLARRASEIAGRRLPMPSGDGPPAAP